MPLSAALGTNVFPESQNEGLWIGIFVVGIKLGPLCGSRVPSRISQQLQGSALTVAQW